MQSEVSSVEMVFHDCPARENLAARQVVLPRMCRFSTRASRRARKIWASHHETNNASGKIPLQANN